MFHITSWRQGRIGKAATTLAIVIVAGIVLCLGAFCTAADAKPASQTRPNIIFILTDDQRWDAMGCLGHEFLKTPNMDRLRNEGVLFRNAFATTALCSPSRASILTGTYAHTHGVMTNDRNDLDAARTPSFPQILREKAGYRTAFVGKWHQDSANAMPRTGFDYWVSFKGHGVYADCPMNENGKEVPTSGYITDVLSDYAVKWLRENGNCAKPFCMFLGHKAPHQPFTPAPRHATHYEGATRREPPDFNDPLTSKPAWQRSAIAFQGIRRSSQTPAGKIPDSFPPRKWDMNETQLNYWRSLQAVDDSVGQILKTLEELGQLDNTVIMFGGDNGYFWGEHRRGDKRLAYEESIRIPLVMRFPPKAKPGSTIDPMVLNIDVAPTLLDLAGVKAPSAMQGASVVPLLASESAHWRTSFLYEYFMDLLPEIPRMEGVRTERWKYVRYPDIKDTDELYDLQSDPYELTNLAGLREHDRQLRTMRTELESLKKKTDFRAVASVGKCTKQTGLMLSLDPARAQGDHVPDTSGKGSKARLVGVSGTKARGSDAFEFTGKEHVAVERSDSLDPSNCPWAVEAYVNPSGDGVVLAQGGDALGYMLFIENGIPCFGVRNGTSFTVADGKDSCIGKWTHLVGAIEDMKVSLYVNGAYVSSIGLSSGLPRNPNDPMSVGADMGSPVEAKLSAVRFKGRMRSVSVWRRSFDEESVSSLARRSQR